MNEHVKTGTAVARLAAPSMPLMPSVAKEFAISENEWRVLVDQIFPTAKTPESVVMALSYCRSRRLDIFKKPVHIVPMWSSALKREVETCWPSIAEIRTTASRTGEYAGIDAVDFGPDVTEEFTIEKWEHPDGDEKKRKVKVARTEVITYPKWASVVVYRIVKGERCAFHTRVFWKEACATIKGGKVPNEMWRKRPYGQVDKCTEAAGLRKAFPEETGSMYAAEEMEGKIYDHTTAEMRVAAAAATVAPDPDGDIVDAEVEDVEETEPATHGGRGGAPDPDEVGDGVVDHSDDGGAPDPDAGDDEPESPRQAVLDKLSDDLAAAKTPDDVQNVWRDYDLDAKWGEGDADHKADLRIARGMMNGRDRALQKTAKK